MGTQTDRHSALESIRTGTKLHSVQLEMFAHLAAPIVINGQVIGAFALGWVPHRFADPVPCDLMAKKLGLNAMELWQLVRMQQPVPREKIQVYASMLEIFAQPILQQLQIQIAEREQSRISRIISETAMLFAEATNERDICMAAMSAIRELVPAINVNIKVPLLKNETEIVEIYESNWDRSASSGLTNRNRQSWLSIPILGSKHSSLGKIELTVEGENPSDEAVEELNALAGQLGVALQKAHLIHELENERSSLKGANSELQQLHKMKDEFLATVSHELRTPLNAILGWAEVLRVDALEGEAFFSAVSTIERNAKSQTRLIEDLLDVSRIISGKMALQREDVEATALVRDVMMTVRPMLEGRKQILKVQLPETPIFLKGDPTRLTQIFWNLLSNASKFTHERGQVSVILETVGHYLRLEITDNGKGISPEFLPQLFNRFSQADSSYTRRHGGLGLGLAIVRHLVELHGGTVSASSQGEGRGATFTVLLPQNASDIELDTAQRLIQSSASGSLRSSLPSLAGISVLIVDDEPDSLRLARFILEKCGALVQIAERADQAYKFLREAAPDILICDISMPGESGYDLIRRVRSLQACQGGQIPAIALTAMAGAESQSLILAAGYQLHLTKPIEPRVLVDSIISILGSQRRQTAIH